jgi:starch phosphorylase
MTSTTKSSTKTNARTASTVRGFEKAVGDNLYYSRGSAIYSASEHDLLTALSYTIRDRLIDRWRKTTDAQFEANPKFVYYLSAEYLLGKQLPQNLLYTDTMDLARQAALISTI